MICMSMGYPDYRDELEIAKGKSIKSQITDIHPVMNALGLYEMQRQVEQVFVHDNIYAYIVSLVSATRNNPYIDLGISPRGTIACTKMAKAYAYLCGRNYVIPEDVTAIFADIAKHRIVLNTKARVSHVTETDVINQILGTTGQPATYMNKVVYSD